MSAGLNSKSQPQGEWWLGYLIRYFGGAIFGAACLFLLSNKPLWNEYFGFPGRVSELKDYHFLVLLVLGLFYSFLAGLPVFVLQHARPIFSAGVGASKRIKNKIAFDTVAYGGTALFVVCLLQWVVLKNYLFIPFFLEAILFGFLMSFCRMVHRNSRFVARFYVRLAKVRSSSFAWVDDYVAAYEQLREYGSSVMILVLASFLFFSLAVQNSVFGIMLTCFLWVFPSLWVWGAAQHQEIYLLANRKKKRDSFY